MNVKAILGRFNGDPEKAADYCRRVIAEYQAVLDSVKADVQRKAEAAHA